MNDLISVIVPVYNAEFYLPKCIESLMIQTYKNIQIVVVNDGSSDSSFEICRQYSEKDFRIKVVNQENSGVSVARNRGVHEAEGDYICFVDADDYVDSNFVKNLYEIHKNNNAELSICGFVELKEGNILNGTSGPVQIMTQAEAMENLLKHNSFRGYACNKMFIKEIITKNNICFDSSIAIWEDVLFIFTYMQYIERAAYDPKPMYYYIYWEKSASHQKNHLIGIEKSYSAIRAKDKLINLVPDKSDGVKRQLDIRYVQSALAVLRNIGYIKPDENSEFYKRSVKILKEYGKKVMPYLSKKDQLLLRIYLINPAGLLLLYRIKSILF